jgi:hypothetical protein
MKKFTFKGKEYNCPECWEDVTLTQLMKINTGITGVFEMIQVCTGIDEKELSQSNEFTLIEQIDQCLSFLAAKELPILELEPKEIVFKGVKVSPFSDIGTKSVAQYQDMKQLVVDFHTIEGEEIDTLKRLSLYPKIVATYLQPLIDQGEYDFKRADEIAIELYNHSAMEVSNWGHFFILRFLELRNGIVNDASKLLTNQKRQRRGFLNSLKPWVGKLYYILYLRGISKGKTI